MSTCIRVESHLIKSKELDELSFCSKNLYNKALYEVRQKFIESYKDGKGVYINCNDLDRLMKVIEEFQPLPAQTRQANLRLLDKNWKSFFRSIKDWVKYPGKYTGKPSLPKYLNKQGRNVLIFPGQNLNIKNGILRLPKTSVEIKTLVDKQDLQEVRVVPQGNQVYKVEVVYKKEITNLELDRSNVVGVDIGLNNLMAITSNQTESNLCCLINGKPVKSINQFYNKQLAQVKYVLKTVNDQTKSKRLNRLGMKRNLKVEDYLHKASRTLIDLCKEFNIGRIVIGHNKGWKQGINLGKKTNQSFVQVPFNRLIQMVQYKAEEVGIEVILTEEAYTSKVDHLALEGLEHQETYLGKRVKRGLFQSSTGVQVNADINGALGILRKIQVASEEFLKTLGGRGCVLQPIKLNC